MTVYALIVYYPNTDKEPKVDVFDDEEWANRTAQMYKDKGWVVCVNPCHLYTTKA